MVAERNKHLQIVPKISVSTTDAARPKIAANPQKFKIENITVARAPLLKIYYWESYDIDGINEKLRSNDFHLHHSMIIPTTQINSKPFRTVFWLRNYSADVLDLRLRRIQNCECAPMQTRVGFNQFRQLYQCPHRRLIYIRQEHIRMQPKDLVALTVIAYFFLFGQHKLTFEFKSGDGRVLQLEFHLDIIGFDPEKCHITRELLPIDTRRYERFVQPIWVRNITLQHLKFAYSTRTRGLRLINPNLTVPCQSVWPLMVQYRPCGVENELELTSHFDCMRTKILLSAKSMCDPSPPEPNVPVADYGCVDFCYVIHPNRCTFRLQIGDERSRMVCIHNYGQKCVEFRWQNYIINDLFEVTFEPSVFRLKSHHSQLCVVIVRASAYVQFKRIPAVLEVHRVLTKSMQIAKQLLQEIESIDDPNWLEDSYMEHVFLHLDVLVQEPSHSPLPQIPEWVPPANPKRSAANGNKHGITTIFEQLFWEHLAKSPFMRADKEPPRISEELSYDQVMHLSKAPPGAEKIGVNKDEILSTLSQLLGEAVRDMSKNWRFVPQENCDD